MKRSYVVITFLFGAAGAAYFFQPRAVAPAEVHASSKPIDTNAPVVAAGRVEPISEEIKIGSELDGKLQSVPIDEGAVVRRGQVIAVIYNGDYSARVELAKATIRQKEAELERVKNGSRSMERLESKSAIREAEAMLDHARLERARRQSILDKGAISRAEFDVADREYNVAEARVESARQRFAFVDADARREDVLRAQAEIEHAQAQLHEAQAELEKTVIRSPIDGVVLHRHLQTGESVSKNGNTPIFTLGDTSRLRVRVDVDEVDVSKLKVGQKAYVTAAAFGDRKFVGTVSRIGQTLGKKRVRTDEPTERVDTKILETLIDLEPGAPLPLGLRVDAFLEPAAR
jgi:HlyD family secretion protein